MVNNFIFIEEGSIDTNNMLKLLQNSGMTDANIIRYKQGMAKPELINLECESEQVNLVEHDKGVAARTEAKIISGLLKFLHECSEQRVDRDVMSNTEHVYTIYRNTPESLVENFKEFLTEEDNRWF